MATALSNYRPRLSAAQPRFFYSAVQSSLGQQAFLFGQVFADPIPAGGSPTKFVDKQEAQRKLDEDFERAKLNVFKGVFGGALAGLNVAAPTRLGGSFNFVKGVFGGLVAIDAIREFNKIMLDLINRKVDIENTIDEVVIVGDASGGVITLRTVEIISKANKSGTGTGVYRSGTSSSTTSTTSTTTTSTTTTTTTSTTTTTDRPIQDKDKGDNCTTRVQDSETTWTTCPREDNEPDPEGGTDDSGSAKRTAEILNWAKSTNLNLGTPDLVPDTNPMRKMMADFGKWADAVGLTVPGSGGPVTDENPMQARLAELEKWAREAGISFGSDTGSTDDWQYIVGKEGWVILNATNAR